MWQGIDFNERLYNGVHNALVDVYLWGVKGVSPERGYTWKMVPPDDADRYIAKARIAYAKLVDQKPPRGRAKSWHDRHVNDLNGLINKAVAVREGTTPQKMTEADYAAYRKSLGLH
jgi:hypothetical protein